MNSSRIYITKSLKLPKEHLEQILGMNFIVITQLAWSIFLRMLLDPHKSIPVAKKTHGEFKTKLCDILELLTIINSLPSALSAYVRISSPLSVCETIFNLVPLSTRVAMAFISLFTTGILDKGGRSVFSVLKFIPTLGIPCSWTPCPARS